MYCVVSVCYVLASFPTLLSNSCRLALVFLSFFLFFFLLLWSCVCGVSGFGFRSCAATLHTIRLVSACLRLLFAAITSLHRIARLYTIIAHGTVFAKHMHAIPHPVVYSASLLLFSVSGVLRFSVIQTLVREIDQTVSAAMRHFNLDQTRNGFIDSNPIEY